MSLLVPNQNYWYPWSTYACHQGDEPQVAKCGVCGVWWGWQVRGGIKMVTRTGNRFKVVFKYLNAALLIFFSRLFEMGFAEQLQEIIRRFPDTRQTLLFSATLPKLLVEFARAGANWKITTFVTVITRPVMSWKLTLLFLLGLTEPVLIRLDVDSKLSDLIKVDYLLCRSTSRFPGVNVW